MSTNIIKRIRDQLPAGATITGDEDTITFTVAGQYAIIFNALKVTCEELERTAYHIIESAKAVSFEKER